MNLNKTTPKLYLVWQYNCQIIKIFFLHLNQFFSFVCDECLLKFSINVYLYVNYIYLKGHIVSSRGQVVRAKKMKITKRVKKATKMKKKYFRKNI